VACCMSSWMAGSEALASEALASKALASKALASKALASKALAPRGRPLECSGDLPHHDPNSGAAWARGE
jgi:hypothetical protein